MSPADTTSARQRSRGLQPRICFREASPSGGQKHHVLILESNTDLSLHSKAATLISSCTMRLLRLAILKTDLTTLTGRAITAAAGDISLQSHSVSCPDGSMSLLLIAQMPLKYLPKITSDSGLVVPEQQRRQLEEFIENIANVISVCFNSPRRISSPSPCVALTAETPADQALLGSAQKLHTPMVTFPNSVALSADFEKHLSELTDRLDGVAMLAEAIATGHASGRFREFIRLFERAFKLNGMNLLMPMTEFFANTRFEFTQDEIRLWLKKRDPITHADQRNEVLFERDVLFEVRRMEMATYDVLFNKSVWRSPNVDRRAVWSPLAWTTSHSGVAVVAGSEATLKFQLFDNFGVYPLDPAAGLHGSLPAEWWTGVGLSGSYEAIMTLHKNDC